MGRKRKDIEDVKTSKSIRMKPAMWLLLKEEQIRLKNKSLVSTLEHIIQTYFKKH